MSDKSDKAKAAAAEAEAEDRAAAAEEKAAADKAAAADEKAAIAASDKAARYSADPFTSGQTLKRGDQTDADEKAAIAASDKAAAEKTDDNNPQNPSGPAATPARELHRLDEWWKNR